MWELDSACSLADREAAFILFKGTGGSVQIIGMSNSSTFQDASKDVQTKVMQITLWSWNSGPAPYPWTALPLWYCTLYVCRYVLSEYYCEPLSSCNTRARAGSTFSARCQACSHWAFSEPADLCLVTNSVSFTTEYLGTFEMWRISVMVALGLYLLFANDVILQLVRLWWMVCGRVVWKSRWALLLSFEWVTPQRILMPQEEWRMWWEETDILAGFLGMLPSWPRPRLAIEDGWMDRHPSNN